MLDFDKMKEFREKLLKKHEPQLYAISLTKDYIVPPSVIMKTLKVANLDINILIDELDFEYDYIY